MLRRCVVFVVKRTTTWPGQAHGQLRPKPAGGHDPIPPTARERCAVYHPPARLTSTPHGQRGRLPRSNRCPEISVPIFEPMSAAITPDRPATRRGRVAALVIAAVSVLVVLGTA